MRVDRTRRASASKVAAVTITKCKQQRLSQPFIKLDTNLPQSTFLGIRIKSRKLLETSLFLYNLQYSTVVHEKVIMPFYHRCSEKSIHKQMAFD